MANKKINELVSRTPSLTDLMLVGDPSSGYSYKCTVNDIALQVEVAVAGNYVTLATAQTISGAKTFSNVLTLTSVANSSVDTDKFLVLTGTNTVNYRTGAEVLSDIGGASSTAISGTTNYIPKFTSATAIGNSVIYETSSNIGIGITSPSARLHVNGTGRYEGGVYMAEAYLSSPNNIVGIIDSTNANGGYLQFSTSSTVFAEMGASQSVLGSGGTDTFALNGKGSRNLILATNATARLTIAAGGNVGIGTSSPNNKFAVSNSGAAGIEFDPVNGGIITYNRSTNAYSPMLNYSSTQIWYIGTTEKMRLEANGDFSLQTISNATTDTDKFLVSDSGVIKYRTGAELLSDIGGASSSSVSGTTNYIPKFTGANTIGNSVIQESSSNIGINITPTAQLTIKDELRVKTSTTSGVGLSKDANGAYLYNIDNTFMAFGTNDTERMRLDASGNLGIGVSNPTYQLTVNTTGYFGGTLTLGGGSRLSAVSGNALNFNTNSTDRMTLDASGNLGLGVTPSAWSLGSPVFQLGNSGVHLFGAGTQAQLGSNAFYNGSNYIYVVNGNATRYIQNSVAGQHEWGTAPSGTAGNAISFTQAMTLDASGRLGIGVTSMSNRLDVGGSIGIGVNGTNDIIWNTAGGIKLSRTNVGPEYAMNQRWTGSLAYIDIASSSQWNGGVTILPNGGGNVGIGTTSPQTELHIKSTSGWAETRIEGASGSGAVLEFYSNGSALGDIYYDASSNYIVRTGSTERMRITSGGELLINTTSDAGDYKLQVNGNSYVNGDMAFGGSQSLRWGSNTYIYGSNNTQIEARVNSNLGWTINSSGNTEFGGSIKTAAPSGFTAQPWKLGDVTVTSITVDTDKYISVDINGTVYNIPTCHPN